MAERDAPAQKAPAKKASPRKTAAKPTTQPERPARPLPHAEEPAASAGFVGAVPDDTPDEHYSLQGVITGKPTPETTT